MRLGNMYGADATFAGVPAADLDDPASFADALAVIVGAPFDGGTSHRPGCRFGPLAIRTTDYLPHDGIRPSLALGVDPLIDLGVVDVGDVEMPSGDTDLSLSRLEDGVARIAAVGRRAHRPRRRPHHRPARCHRRGPPRGVGQGVGRPLRCPRRHRRPPVRVADRVTARPCAASSSPERSRGDRFLQIGLRGYWPDPETLTGWPSRDAQLRDDRSWWPAGSTACLDRGLRHRHRRVRRRVPVGRRRRGRPGLGSGTGTPEPGGLSPRQLLDAVRRVAMELPLAGVDIVELSPPFDHAEVTAYLGNRIVLEALSGIAWRQARSAGQSVRQPLDPLLDR